MGLRVRHGRMHDPRQHTQRAAMKADMRRAIWQLLSNQQVSRFPGAENRIPHFTGAEAAAHLLQELTVWHKARAVKINADAPQLPVRRVALTDGKLLYLAVPRLKSGQCFIELDPQRLGSRCPLVNSLRGALKYGRLVAPREMRHIDLIVCGSVAAGRDGDGSGWEGDLPTRSTLCCAMQAKCGNSRRL